MSEQSAKTGTDLLNELYPVRKEYPPPNQPARVIPRPVLLGESEKKASEGVSPPPSRPPPASPPPAPSMPKPVAEAAPPKEEGGAVPPKITLQGIKEAGALIARLKVAYVEGPKRHRRLARLRQALMYFSYTCGKRYTTWQIGGHYGGRDHTTVLHALKTIEEIRAKGAKTENDERALKLLTKLCKHFGIPLESLKQPEDKHRKRSTP